MYMEALEMLLRRLIVRRSFTRQHTRLLDFSVRVTAETG